MIANTIKTAYRGMILDGLLDLKNQYSVRIRKDFETACWSFKKGLHSIFVGDKILDRAKRAGGRAHYVASFLFHEVAHSLWTERDLDAINKACRHAKVSFQHLNLFEDARIEHLMREKIGRKFGWLDVEETPEVIKPLSLFFLLVQSDGDEAGAKEVWMELKKVSYLFGQPMDEATAKVEAEDICEFYRRTIACADTWEVVQICKEWNERWPEPEQQQQSQLGDMGYDGNGDMSQALQMQIDTSAQAQAEADSVAIAGEGSKNDKEGNGKGKSAAEDHGKPLQEFSSCDYKTHPETTIDVKAASKLLPKLEKLFESTSSMASSSSPSKRLNIRGIARGDMNKPYRVKSESGVEKKMVSIVVDMSGSMGGDPIAGAANIAYLISELARKGKVFGHVILSGTRGYQTFALPMSKDAIESHFAARGGGEGLANTFQEVEPLLASSDWVFVLTDGHLTDGEIDRSKLHKKGVYPIGMYVGQAEDATLEKWFDKTIKRETVEGLVDELTRKLR